MQGRRSFWAWGLETDEPTDAQREETAARLSQRWGREISAPPLPKIEDIQLRPPRVSPPGPLAAICTTETHDRAAHSYGKSYRDTIRAVRGQFPNPPDVVAYPRTEAEVVAAAGITEPISTLPKPSPSSSAARPPSLSMPPARPGRACHGKTGGLIRNAARSRR